MRSALCLFFLCAGVAACGGNGSTNTDMGGGGPMLTVNNTLSWCTVTVTINGMPTSFGGASMGFPAAAGTTVMLQADPKPTFKPVVWTGVTTMNGDMATYTMTAAAQQTVTACCPLSDGTGC